MNTNEKNKESAPQKEIRYVQKSRNFDSTIVNESNQQDRPGNARMSPPPLLFVNLNQNDTHEGQVEQQHAESASENE